MTRRLLRSLVAAAACAAAARAPAVRAQTAAGLVRLLDVPYLAQTESLCGGAAAAMVMRFWGTHDVYPETFGSLVDRASGGIHANDLVAALRARGWQTTAFKGDAATVRSHLDRGRPIVVLIQDRADTFHYVVIVGWSAGRVVVHDPARAPFRVTDERAFLSAWAASGNWALLVLPAADEQPVSSPAASRRTADPAAPTPSTACGEMVFEGVRLAEAGEMDDARRMLEGATSICPRASDAWRELAGIHAVEREWKAAAEDARQALALDARDEHAVRILATSLFLENQRDEALAVWNRLDVPAIDLVNVTGLERTRYEVMAEAIGLRRGETLTVGQLARARRRLAEVPSVMTGRVSFTPADADRAQVDAAVVERPLMPTDTAFLASTVARALTDRELLWSVASPSGGGELLSIAWRWWENRPRVGLRFSAPSSTRVLGGVWTVDGFVDRQTYGGTADVIERRSGVAFKTADWIDGNLRWEAALGVDGWSDRGTSVSVSATAEQHLVDDRLVVALRGSLFRHAVQAATAGARVQWQSANRHEGGVWLAETGIEGATASAPKALWAGAGTGQGRDVLLRAHPLLTDGAIDDGVFGRQLAHANFEWRRWTQWSGRPIRVAPAMFVDAARAYQRLIGLRDRSEVDAGAGIRVAVPGGSVLRIDIARGLRDGTTALSMGWTR